LINLGDERIKIFEALKRFFEPGESLTKKVIRDSFWLFLSSAAEDVDSLPSKVGYFSKVLVLVNSTNVVNLI
jgi:hypothetical protein